jgi:hypothetical protein
MTDRRTRRTRERDLTFPLQLGGFALGIAVLFVGLPYILLGRTPSVESNTSEAVNAPVAAPAAAVVPTAAPVAPAVKPTPEPVVAKKPAAPKPAAKKPVAKPKPKPKTPNVSLYSGLGAWIDIYDDPAWRDPASTVRNMASHGVKTLYIETANSKQKFAIKDPAKMAVFIDQAHAHKMNIVAWYLPDFANENLDNARIAAAVKFHTKRGQSFDSFTLDIESPVVKDEAARNRAFARVSDKLRKLAGPTYPLGGCIPAPAAIAHPGSMWYRFPYDTLGKYYDAVLPMSYYTYHQRGYANVYADTVANLKVLKANKATAKMPIHMIGGETGSTTIPELQAFLAACRAYKAYGAGIYEWQGTTAAMWQQLSTVK